ncbi:unnamed protein product, partial [Ranitomeya imitator]
STPHHITTQSRPPTLPHEALSTHITARGSVHTNTKRCSVPPHYHMKLHPHTLPHVALSPHYHMRLRPHTLPHEAPSSHITTRGSVLTHYHTKLRPPTHYHTKLHPHTLPHEALSPHITTRGSVLTLLAMSRHWAGYIGGLSKALQNAADKPLMAVAEVYMRKMSSDQLLEKSKIGCKESNCAVCTVGCYMQASQVK